MLQIHKYGKTPKRYIKLRHLRNIESNSCDPCRKPCPPSYVCKQPKCESEFDIWLKKLREEVHPFLKCRTPKDYKPYKNMNLFLCLPLCLCWYINCTYMQPHRKRPKFIAFEYMRRRGKTFPWDKENKRTLFHNPYYNALPDGYEFEVPEEEEFDPRIERCKPK